MAKRRTGQVFYGICVPRVDGVPPNEQKLISNERGSLEIYCTACEAQRLADKINKQYNKPDMFQVFEVELNVLKLFREEEL